MRPLLLEAKKDAVRCQVVDLEGELRDYEGLKSGGFEFGQLDAVRFVGRFLDVSPDYVIHERRDVLEEVDGPMLRHWLQGKRILVPSRRAERPDEGRLGRFLGVG